MVFIKKFATSLGPIFEFPSALEEELERKQILVFFEGFAEFVKRGIKEMEKAHERGQ